MSDSKKSILLFCVKDHAMHPTLQEGDTVVVDRQRTTLRDNCLYAVRFDDEIHVRRIKLNTDGLVEIVCDSDLPPHKDPPVQELDVIGQVILLCRTFA